MDEGGTCRRRRAVDGRRGRPVKPSAVALAPPSPLPLAVARAPLLGLAGTERPRLDEKGRDGVGRSTGAGRDRELGASSGLPVDRITRASC